MSNFKNFKGIFLHKSVFIRGGKKSGLMWMHKLNYRKSLNIFKWKNRHFLNANFLFIFFESTKLYFHPLLALYRRHCWRSIFHFNCYDGRQDTNINLSNKKIWIVSVSLKGKKSDFFSLLLKLIKDLSSFTTPRVKEHPSDTLLYLTPFMMMMLLLLLKMGVHRLL